MYTFQNRCDQATDTLLDDGAYRCFFNTGGHVGDVPEQLKELLEYMNNAAEYNVSESGNELIRRIDSIVADLKLSDEWRQSYMVYELKLNEKWKEGREEGRMEGRIEGKMEGMLDMLLKMIKSGMSHSAIAGISGFPIEKIEELAAQA